MYASNLPSPNLIDRLCCFLCRLMLDDSKVQHEKLVLMLVEPNIIGFSVPKLQSLEQSDEPPNKKQKVNM